LILTSLTRDTYISTISRHIPSARPRFPEDPDAVRSATAHLLRRALDPVLPSIEEFPYAIRAVSETFESNGSTSMGSTCASCMALMAAGVPIKKQVAGISCGLVTGDTDDDFVLLTDIQGLEDFFGDMDFKVTGTHDGITAIQMDIKIHGLTRPIVEGAIQRCKDAREYIMQTVMTPAIAEPRKEVGKYAPKIIFTQIDPEKIGDVVGKQGKVINEIIKRTGAQIDIEDDGKVSICGSDKNALAEAKKMVDIIVTDYGEGQILEGTVVSIKEFGAFVEFAPGKEGMVHISRITNHRVEHVEDVLSIGQHVTVKCIGKDRMGRMSFSMKDAPAASVSDLTGDPAQDGGSVELPRVPAPGPSLSSAHSEEIYRPEPLAKLRDRRPAFGPAAMTRHSFKYTEKDQLWQQH
jgi:polyribonucleotide nucleotidyltransferase